MDKITAKLEKAIDKTTCWEESVELVMQSIKEIEQLQIENDKLRKESMLVTPDQNKMRMLQAELEFRRLGKADQVKQLEADLDELKKDVELSDKLCPIGSTNSCGYWAKLQEEIEKIQAELQQQKNDNIDIEDDLSWHKAIFDGSWPQAVEILEQTLKKVKAIKGE